MAQITLSEAIDAGKLWSKRPDNRYVLLSVDE